MVPIKRIGEVQFSSSQVGGDNHSPLVNPVTEKDLVRRGLNIFLVMTAYTFYVAPIVIVSSLKFYVPKLSGPLTEYCTKIIIIILFSLLFCCF